jgi:hypothetical protein
MPIRQLGILVKNGATWRRSSWRRKTTAPAAIDPVPLKNPLRQIQPDCRNLTPPAYAKAYLRRNKTDPAGAEAIGEAMAAVHRVRERLVAPRPQTINMLRRQMAEFGVVAAKSLPRAKAGGPRHVKSWWANWSSRTACPSRCARFCWGWSGC